MNNNMILASMPEAVPIMPPPSMTVVYLVRLPAWARVLRRVLEAALRWTERFETYEKV